MCARRVWRAPRRRPGTGHCRQRASVCAGRAASGSDSSRRRPGNPVSVTRHSLFRPTPGDGAPPAGQPRCLAPSQRGGDIFCMRTCARCSRCTAVNTDITPYPTDQTIGATLSHTSTRLSGPPPSPRPAPDYSALHPAPDRHQTIRPHCDHLTARSHHLITQSQRACPCTNSGRSSPTPGVPHQLRESLTNSGRVSPTPGDPHQVRASHGACTASLTTLPAEQRRHWAAAAARWFYNRDAYRCTCSGRVLDVLWPCPRRAQSATLWVSRRVVSSRRC